MSTPRYLYADFSGTAQNYGNCIIDYATRRLLNEILPEPVAEFDWFAPSWPEGEYDFAIVPGCTMLSTIGNPSMCHVTQLGYPVYCLAGAIWAPLAHPGYLIRTRVVRRREPKVDLRIAQRMAPPVGARDSFTRQTLSRAGIETLYVGCPTLFLSPDGVGDDGYVLVTLGRGHTRAQTRMANRLSREHNVIGLCHERWDYGRFRAAGWGLPLITYEGDIELYLSYFKRARVVVTGRLHGALPSLAYGKRVFYYGTRDTRTTLLDDLGVPIHSYADLRDPVGRASDAFNRYLLDFFRSNWDQVVAKTIGRHVTVVRS